MKPILLSLSDSAVYLPRESTASSYGESSPRRLNCPRLQIVFTDESRLWYYFNGGRQAMRSTEQIRAELLAALSQLGRLRPEWRLGQTLANVAMTAGRLEPGGVWDLEDEEALAAAKRLLEQYSELGPLVADADPLHAGRNGE
jgi:hypothetical protein